MEKTPVKVVALCLHDHRPVNSLSTLFTAAPTRQELRAPSQQPGRYWPGAWEGQLTTAPGRTWMDKPVCSKCLGRCRNSAGTAGLPSQQRMAAPPGTEKRGHTVSVLGRGEAFKLTAFKLVNLPCNQGLTVEATHGFPAGEYSSFHTLGSKQEHRGFCWCFFALSPPC